MCVFSLFARCCFNHVGAVVLTELACMVGKISYMSIKNTIELVEFDKMWI